MLNFNDYFKDEYQFSLKDISYSKIEVTEPSECELKISDTVSANPISDLLNITFTRDVYFEPASMFKLSVSFDILLYFKEEAREKSESINWCQELTETQNVYFGNIVSRVSHLIAEITASFGQQPLITPPNLITAMDSVV